jgi:hypothetical protein
VVQIWGADVGLQVTPQHLALQRHRVPHRTTDTVFEYGRPYQKKWHTAFHCSVVLPGRKAAVAR